ncbi:DUF2254 domain-containing protein [Pararhizobium mangrovi]|nr:DUF2254 domain-containing protein [Pararhizobium mangrovi]
MNRKAGSLRETFNSLGGLLSVPGTIALGLWALSVPALLLDHAFGSGAFPGFVRIGETTAYYVLSAIATAAIATLGVVYSLVLIVFTLAAGNIGPRLLQRFTRDRVNQITAGLLGGTFLFSIVVLHQTDKSHVPSLSIAFAVVLSVLSVLQLIYFVHSASKSVTIDEEIAIISSGLKIEIDRVTAKDEDGDDPETVVQACRTPVKAARSGYVEAIVEDDLMALARRHDLRIDFVARPGLFVVEGMMLARHSAAADGEIETAIRDAVELVESRTATSNIAFSLDLLIEMALRALSPAVNDAFTAVACVDQFTAAMIGPVTHGLRGHVRCDTDDTPRLHVPGMTVGAMLGEIFHPLRRAAASNLLVTRHLADALLRLDEIANDDVRPLLRHHARLLAEEQRLVKCLDQDERDLETLLSPLLEGKNSAGAHDPSYL